MKKILFGLIVAIAAISARAEYLYWSVGTTTEVDGRSVNSYNYAVLYARNESTGVSTALSTKSVVVSDYADLGVYVGTDYTYYIELINYNSSGPTATLAGSSYDSRTAYADIGACRWDGSEIAKASVMAFTGGTFHATPEPTSGLLMLMGFAMLGLKRKKEV